MIQKLAFAINIWFWFIYISKRKEKNYICVNVCLLFTLKQSYKRV